MNNRNNLHINLPINWPDFFHRALSVPIVNLHAYGFFLPFFSKWSISSGKTWRSFILKHTLLHISSQWCIVLEISNIAKLGKNQPLQFMNLSFFQNSWHVVFVDHSSIFPSCFQLPLLGPPSASRPSGCFSEFGSTKVSPKRTRNFCQSLSHSSQKKNPPRNNMFHKCWGALKRKSVCKPKKLQYSLKRPQTGRMQISKPLCWWQNALTTQSPPLLQVTTGQPFNWKFRFRIAWRNARHLFTGRKVPPKKERQKNDRWVVLLHFFRKQKHWTCTYVGHLRAYMYMMLV